MVRRGHGVCIGGDALVNNIACCEGFYKHAMRVNSGRNVDEKQSEVGE